MDGIVPVKTGELISLLVFFLLLLVSVASLILGIFLGICLSYFAYFVLTRRVEEVSYVFPYKGIIYSVLIVSGLIFMIMRYSLRMIDKNSLMSVIRQDNI